MQASFSSAFLRGDPAVGRFLPADFRDPAARGLVIRRAAGRPQPVPEALLTELRAQNPDAATNRARREHLDALAAPGTTVVVTGQQVGLFLGPLYTFYKAASAIALARALAAESGARCVPIFWLQTEDHDYEEIRSCRVAVPGAAPLRLALPADAVPARCSIAHRALGAEISELHAALDAALPALSSLPGRAAVLDLFRRHYRPGATLAAAFAGALSEIFADEGLLVLSPRCAAVAELARPVLEQALAHHRDIGQRLLERGLALRAAGLCEQVPARSDATLFFFHSDVTGPRYRLERGGGCAGFTNPDPRAPADQRTLSEVDLRAILRAEPLRFSTSALLRPLVQDTLLPTVAYVGGPGEISYFAQLAPLYELFGVAMPLVVPRGRFRLISARARSLLEQLGLGAAAIEAPVAEVVRRALLARSDSAKGTEGPEGNALPDPAALRQELLADVGQRLDALLVIEPGLESAVKRTRVSVSRNIDKLLARYDRLRTERDRTLIERIERAQALLFPDGAPQERGDSVISYACQLGLGALKEKVFSRLGPGELFAPAVRDLEL